MRSVRDQLLMVEELRQAGAREQALALCRDLVREARVLLLEL